MKKAFYPLLCCFLFSLSSSAQLYIDQSVTPEVMMMDFFNTDMATVTNVQTSGDISIAFFEGANAELGLNAGIFLSTGDVNSAIGPNDSEATSGIASDGGDSDLTAITTAEINQQSLIEMDIVPDNSMLNFKYVFASEEYCEFVNSTFNDVFGFFVSGPGISGPYSNNGINIAMLPDGSAAAINSVNHLMNDQFFVGNSTSCGTGVINNFISFDGMTVTMDASLDVVPGETYHVRIGVGDAGDGIFDSGVFIGIESLGGNPMLTPPSMFSASIDNGVITVENESKYATSYFWDFGDGVTSEEKNPGEHTYDFSAQSEYTLSLTTQNYCCTDTYSIVVTENVNAIDEHPALQAIHFFPNPAKDEMTINGLSETGELQAYNQLGQLIHTQTIGPNESIAVGDWPRGLYLVSVQLAAYESPAIRRVMLK